MKAIPKTSREIIERQKIWNRRNRDKRKIYNSNYRNKPEVKIRLSKYHHNLWINRHSIQRKTIILSEQIKKLYLYSFSPDEISYLLNTQVNSINSICKNYAWDDELKFCRTCYQETDRHMKCDICKSGIHDIEKIVDIRHIPNFINFPDDIQERRLGLYRIINKQKVCRFCEEEHFSKNEKNY